MKERHKKVIILKEKFIYLYKLKYNNKNFKIFWNKHTGCFPLEIINDKLVYPIYDDYINIYKILETTPYSDISLHFLDDSASSFIDNLKSNVKQKIKYYIFQPLVRTAAIGLVSFSIVLSMSGCTFAGISQEEKSAYSVEQLDEIEEKAKENNIEIDYNEKLETFFVKKYYDKNKMKDIIIVDDLENLKQYLPDANQNPTFEDLHNTIDNNPNIQDDIKLKFHEIVNNLEKNQPNFNLFLLNYNIERMEVNIDNSNEYIAGKTAGKLASFNSRTGQVNLNYTNLPLYVFAHELGHAAFSIDTELDDNTNISYNIYPVEYDSFFKTIHKHTGSDEGLANLFSLDGCDKTQFTSYKNNSYVPLTEGMNFILNSIDWKLEDISNADYTLFLETIHEQGIKDPVSTISKLTKIYNDHIDDREYDPEAYGLEDWTFDYALEIGQSEILKNKENTTKKIEDLFSTSVYDEKVCFYILEGDGTLTSVDEYDREKTKKAVLNELDRQNGNILEKVENIFDRED